MRTTKYSEPSSSYLRSKYSFNSSDFGYQILLGKSLSETLLALPVIALIPPFVAGLYELSKYRLILTFILPIDGKLIPTSTHFLLANSSFSPFFVSGSIST